IAKNMAPGTTPAETDYAAYWAMGCYASKNYPNGAMPPLPQIHNILKSGALTARSLVAGIVSSSDLTSAESAVEAFGTDISSSQLDIVKAVKASTSSSGAVAQCAATFVAGTFDTATGPYPFLAAASLALESYDGAFIQNLLMVAYNRSLVTNTTSGDWLSVGNVLAGMTFPGGQKGLTYNSSSVGAGIIVSLASGATSLWEALASVLFALSSGDVDHDLSFLGPY
ncbi:unnamed protein product, partial [Polarella glacialis]